MRKLLLIFASLLGTNVLAQDIKVQINGLQFCADCTKEDMLNAFGKNPTKVVESEEFPNFYYYYYDEDFFAWNGGYFGACHIYSNRYAFQGLIRVGDNISAIDKLGGIKEIMKHNYGENAGYIKWYPTVNDKFDYIDIIFDYNTTTWIIRRYMCFIIFSDTFDYTALFLSKAV